MKKDSKHSGKTVKHIFNSPYSAYSIAFVVLMVFVACSFVFYHGATGYVTYQNITSSVCNDTIYSNSSAVFTLQNDIYVSDYVVRCLEFTGSDVTLDCDGHSITLLNQDTSNPAILFNGPNAVMKNCNLSHQNIGKIAVWSSASDSVISNNTMHNFYIQMSAVNNVSVVNNTLYNSTIVEMIDSNGVVISGNIISMNPNQQSIIVDGNESIIQGNTFLNGGFNGVIGFGYQTYGTNISIYDNNFSNVTNILSFGQSSTTVNFTNNMINGCYQTCVYVSLADSIFNANNFTNSTGSIVFYNSTNDYITNNNFQMMTLNTLQNVTNTIITNNVGSTCGNSNCESGEDTGNCPQDCTGGCLSDGNSCSNSGQCCSNNCNSGQCSSGGGCAEDCNSNGNCNSNCGSGGCPSDPDCGGGGGGPPTCDELCSAYFNFDPAQTCCNNLNSTACSWNGTGCAGSLIQGCPDILSQFYCENITAQGAPCLWNTTSSICTNAGGGGGSCQLDTNHFCDGGNGAGSCGGGTFYLDGSGSCFTDSNCQSQNECHSCLSNNVCNSPRETLTSCPNDCANSFCCETWDFSYPACIRNNTQSCPPPGAYMSWAGEYVDPMNSFNCQPGSGNILPVCPVCGNGNCDSGYGENATNCVNDCGGGGGSCQVAGSECFGGTGSNSCNNLGGGGPFYSNGNGRCYTNSNCQSECFSCLQNGVCNSPRETPVSCLSDCTSICGDNLCTSPETDSTCPQDCGSVPSINCTSKTSVGVCDNVLNSVDCNSSYSITGYSQYVPCIWSSQQSHCNYDWNGNITDHSQSCYFADQQVCDGNYQGCNGLCGQGGRPSDPDCNVCTHAYGSVIFTSMRPSVNSYIGFNPLTSQNPYQMIYGQNNWPIGGNLEQDAINFKDGFNTVVLNSGNNDWNAVWTGLEVRVMAVPGSRADGSVGNYNGSFDSPQWFNGGGAPNDIIYNNPSGGFGINCLSTCVYEGSSCSASSDCCTGFACANSVCINSSSACVQDDRCGSNAYRSNGNCYSDSNCLNIQSSHDCVRNSSCDGGTCLSDGWMRFGQCNLGPTCSNTCTNSGGGGSCQLDTNHFCDGGNGAGSCGGGTFYLDGSGSCFTDSNCQSQNECHSCLQNSVCNSPRETPTSCPQDCGGGCNQDCSGGNGCNSNCGQGSCSNDPDCGGGGSFCGNRVCETGETDTTCPEDCLPDSDHDGVPDVIDTCPAIFNPDYFYDASYTYVSHAQLNQSLDVPGLFTNNSIDSNAQLSEGSDIGNGTHIWYSKIPFGPGNNPITVGALFGSNTIQYVNDNVANVGGDWSQSPFIEFAFNWNSQSPRYVSCAQATDADFYIGGSEQPTGLIVDLSVINLPFSDVCVRLSNNHSMKWEIRNLDDSSYTKQASVVLNQSLDVLNGTDRNIYRTEGYELGDGAYVWYSKIPTADAIFSSTLIVFINDSYNTTTGWPIGGDWSSSSLVEFAVSNITNSYPSCSAAIDSDFGRSPSNNSPSGFAINEDSPGTNYTINNSCMRLVSNHSKMWETRNFSVINNTARFDVYSYRSDAPASFDVYQYHENSTHVTVNQGLNLIGILNGSLANTTMLNLSNGYDLGSNHYIWYSKVPFNTGGNISLVDALYGLDAVRFINDVAINIIGDWMISNKLEFSTTIGNNNFITKSCVQAMNSDFYTGDIPQFPAGLSQNVTYFCARDTNNNSQKWEIRNLEGNVTRGSFDVYPYLYLHGQVDSDKIFECISAGAAPVVHSGLIDPPRLYWDSSAGSGNGSYRASMATIDYNGTYYSGVGGTVSLIGYAPNVDLHASIDSNSSEVYRSSQTDPYYGVDGTRNLSLMVFSFNSTMFGSGSFASYSVDIDPVAYRMRLLVPNSTYRIFRDVFIAHGLHQNYTWNQPMFAYVNCSALDSSTCENYPECLLDVVINDGRGDACDPITGFAYDISSNVHGLNATIDGSSDLNANYTGIHRVSIFNATRPLMEFDWNFTERGLNLFSINVTIQSPTDTNGYILIKGLTLTDNHTKSVFVDAKRGTNTLCIQDADILNISSITSTCNGTDEYVLTCPGTNGTYSCSIFGSMYNVSGLRRSGVTEISASTPPTTPTQPTHPSSGGGGSSVCSIIWSCGDWTECSIYGNQVRICKDNGTCGLDNKTESQQCVPRLIRPNETLPALPSCNDGKLNQDESDIDCGGIICSFCKDKSYCRTNSDCVGNQCYNNLCVTPSCYNQIKEGYETDIDCGGRLCKPCETPKRCVINSDCASYSCSNGRCIDVEKPSAMPAFAFDLQYLIFVAIALTAIIFSIIFIEPVRNVVLRKPKRNMHVHNHHRK